jgi:hypothetical protein
MAARDYGQVAIAKMGRPSRLSTTQTALLFANALSPTQKKEYPPDRRQDKTPLFQLELRGFAMEWSS